MIFLIFSVSTGTLFYSIFIFSHHRSNLVHAFELKKKKGCGFSINNTMNKNYVWAKVDPEGQLMDYHLPSTLSEIALDTINKKYLASHNG